LLSFKYTSFLYMVLSKVNEQWTLHLQQSFWIKIYLEPSFEIFSFSYKIYTRTSDFNSNIWKTVQKMEAKLNPFTGNFNLPKRKCLNGPYWFFFDEIINFFNHNFQLWWCQKKVFNELSDPSRCDYKKNYPTNFAH
jgi:hypothetical protein